MNLTEAFQKLDLLESEDFDISSTQGSKDLQNFLDNDEDTNDIDIMDLEAEDEESLEDSYIGKIVTECVICKSKFYKNPDEIVIDEETGNCNLDEECPICFSMDGYKVVGKIVPYDGDKEITDEKPIEDTEVEVDDSDADGNIEVEVTTDEKEDDIEESLKECNKHFKKVESLDEDIESATIETDDTVMTMDSDESGKVTITSEPKNEEVSDTPEGETIAPIDMEDAIDIADAQPEEETEDESEEEVTDEEETEASEDDFDVEPEDEEVDMDVDEFDEESFDDLGESYLKKVYENVNSYKTSTIKSDGNKIIVEGVINFNSGKSKKTSFIFESNAITNSGKVKFIGENAQITRGRKAFTITGKIDGKKFISESLNYNYRQKDSNGNSTRLYGTVKK